MDNNGNDDFYESDTIRSEKLIAENEMNRMNDTINNQAFNEGFFTTCSLINQEKYDQGFNTGKGYSLEFGKLIGMIDGFLFYVIELGHEEDSTYKEVNEDDMKALMIIKEKLEEFQEEIKDDYVNQIKQEIKKIIDKYI